MVVYAPGICNTGFIMEMYEKIRMLREAEGLGRTLFSRKAGIPENRLKTIELKGNNPGSETLTAICTNFPQYTLWLMTGKSDPISGQISPEIENQRGAINSQ